MKRTSVSLTDELRSALDRYRRDHGESAPVGATVQAALAEYLTRRGYPPARERSFLHVTPSERGSGAADGSVVHDRVLAEAATAR